MTATRRPPHRSWDPRRTPDPETLRRAVEAHTAGDVDLAAQLYVELDTKYPPHWHARMMGALLHYQRTSDPTHALDILPEVILHKPRWPDPRYNLGVVLEGMGNFTEAARRFGETVAMEPAHSQAWTNLGNCRLAMADTAGALEAFEHALALNPHDVTGQYNLSHVYGLLGRWEECYRLYELRWLMPGHLRDHGLPRLVPAWDGTPTGHLIVTGEQGAGDMIQYLRFLPRLQRLARRVTLIVRHEALVPLIQHNYPGVRALFLDAALPLSEQADRVPDADAHVPLLSVVARLGLGPHQVQPTRYLLTPSRFLAMGTPKIGLCWAGSPTHKRDATRSIPFDVMRPLLDVDGVRFINLTLNPKGDVTHPRLEDWRPQCRDYLQSAALFQELHGIITVDSSPLHLAGALGIPTLGLLAAAPDFRWGMEGDRSPWYDSVQMIRQTRGDDWASVIARVQALFESGWPHFFGDNVTPLGTED